MNWSFWIDVIFYSLIGIFAIKLFFFDFPIFTGARSWPNYFKKASIIVSIFLVWFGFGHLSEKYPESTFILILFMVLALFGIMIFSSNSKHKEEDI